MTKEDREYLRRRAERMRQARENARFERENQPRDEEEARNVEAEDKHLADNFDALLNQAARMSDEDFNRAVGKGSFKRKMRKAGTSKAKLAKARAKKRSSWCVVWAVALLLVSAAELAVIASGAVELVNAVTP